MMRTFFMSVVLGSALVLVGMSSALALQSGGVEIGDLETGSVVGQPFKELDVDLTFAAMKVGGHNAWYPPTQILNLRSDGTSGRAGRPVLLKVTNTLSTDYQFDLSADSRFAGPTSMHIKLTLKPGETKYIGIPTSDLTYVTAAGLLLYKNPNDPSGLGGQLLILK